LQRKRVFQQTVSQTLVRNGEGWHITTILPVANTQLK
jgi:hypothetical protein